MEGGGEEDSGPRPGARGGLGVGERVSGGGPGAGENDLLAQALCQNFSVLSLWRGPHVPSF